MAGVLLGVVVSYDGETGMGAVREESGEQHPFHSTAIADGTRAIEPGAPVAFVLERHHQARVEARFVTKLSPQESPGSSPSSRGGASA